MGIFSFQGGLLRPRPLAVDARNDPKTGPGQLAHGQAWVRKVVLREISLNRDT